MGDLSRHLLPDVLGSERVYKAGVLPLSHSPYPKNWGGGESFRDGWHTYRGELGGGSLK